MSELAEEVVDLIKRNGPQTSWWRRMVLIVAANGLGTLIGGGLLGFCAIVWTKANTTDSLIIQITENANCDRLVRDELMLEIAKLKVHHEKADAAREEFVGPVMSPPQAEAPSAAEVEKAKEEIQKKLDKAIYRQQR